MRYRHSTGHESTLKILCKGEKASHRGPRTVELPFYEMSSIGEFLETESRLVVAWSLGGGEGGHDRMTANR